MEFDNKIPEWKNEGTEPSEKLKTGGFPAKYKPPASLFNWLFSTVSKAINEIQTKLSNVSNTADSEKSVKFASEAGIGRKVANALIVRFKGGNTEGTDKWTFDGSTSRSVNITPDKIGAANKSEVIRIVNAERTISEDGSTEVYVATDSEITSLVHGMELTIIPSDKNTTLQPRLDLNGLGSKAIRIGHSFNYAATNALKANYFQGGRPVKLKYDANCELGIQGSGAWILADKQKTSAQDLYGTVPVESGGTGAATVDEAIENLGLSDVTRVESGSYVGTGYEKDESGNMPTVTIPFAKEHNIVYIVQGDIVAIFFRGCTTAHIFFKDDVVNGTMAVPFTAGKKHNITSVTWENMNLSWKYNSGLTNLGYKALNDLGVTYTWYAM